MAGQINLELLIRVAAEQAKRELAAVTSGAKTLTTAADQLGSTANATGGQLDAITTGNGQISGSMNVEDANRLAVLLRAGALPAEMTFLEERTIGPELGQDSIDAGR